MVFGISRAKVLQVLWAENSNFTDHGAGLQGYGFPELGHMVMRFRLDVFEMITLF